MALPLPQPVLTSLYSKRSSLMNAFTLISFVYPLLSVAMVCWTFHYTKRILETLFVHRFSHATMPLRNLFKVRGRYYSKAVSDVVYVCRTVATTGDLLLLCPISSTTRSTPLHVGIY